MIYAEIGEKGCNVRFWHQSAEIRKCISVKDFIYCLQGSISEIDNYQQTPIMPQSTLHYLEKSPTMYQLTMYQAPKISEIAYESRTYKVGFPGLVYTFTVNNKRLWGVKAFAVKDELVKPNSQLFKYPFFNSGDKGSICLGSNQIHIELPWHLHRVPAAIDAIPGSGAYRCAVKLELEGDSFLKSIENKPFPEKILISADMTLGGYLKSMIDQ